MYAKTCSFSPGGQRPGRLSPCLLVFWAVLLSCLYLPTLATPFDFVDDGACWFTPAADVAE